MRNKDTHILLVEDNPLDVANIVRAFKVQGIENQVVVASNGRIALNMLQGLGMPALAPVPRLIILDLALPEMGGIEFLRELRKDPALKPCCVFVMTGHKAEKELLQAYHLQVAGYIVKPLHHHSFQEAVQTLHAYWDLIELPQ